MALFVDDKTLNSNQRLLMEVAAIQRTGEENALRAAQKIRDAELEAEKQAAFEKEWAETKAAEKRAAEKKAADDRKLAAQNLEADLRKRFFEQNPNGLESDFLRLKDRLKDELFIERMKNQESTESYFKKTSVRM